MVGRTVDPLRTPREALDAARGAEGTGSAAVAAGVAPKGSRKAIPAGTSVRDRARADFRVFLTLVWRYLLGNDPNPIQLDLAYWLQHGPDRAVIMAFRGFSKSWITGAYAVWRLWVDPEEKILVVSGSLGRAVATSTWCLELIRGMEILKELRPKPKNRQSGSMFDVGNCTPAQSASFMALGIGGQLVGFRGTCIIPDDVETQVNSETVTGRAKNIERVKEFESVLVPGGVIKYLGTPHDSDSLYLYLLRLKNEDKTPVYHGRIWPAQFPTEEEQKAYSGWLAPYITNTMRKLGPSYVGKSTMPMRFTDVDLGKRKAAMGSSEYKLQFMLDLSGVTANKYPLKLRNLITMALDDQRGPEEVAWGSSDLQRDLPLMGFDGDFYYKPAHTGPTMAPWERVVGWLDPSGKGADQTSLSVVAYLMGRVFFLHQFKSTDGYGPETLTAIAKACVRFGVHELHIEEGGVGATFGTLMQPYLQAAWRVRNAARRKLDRKADEGSTSVIPEKTGRVGKEARILGVLEPVTEQHRLVVSEELIKEDYEAIQRMEGEDTRRYYAWAYQFSHLSREKDCLAHDDNIDSLAGAVSVFSELLGVDPHGLAETAADDRLEAELEALFEESDEAVGLGSRSRPNDRAKATLPARR